MIRYQKLWTVEEKALLVSLYGTVKTRELLPQFPGRSVDSLIMMAHHLGLTVAARGAPHHVPTAKPKKREYGWHKHALADYG